MKTDIHPTYYPKAKVKCACGNEFTIGSTRENIQVEICSACHPFYTGQDKVIDTAGRVERFKARQKTASEKKAASASRGLKKQKPVAASAVKPKVIKAKKKAERKTRA